MNIYEKNLRYIEKHNPVLYEALKKKSALYKVNLEKVDNQFNYIIENENARCFVHSVYNKNNEMKNMFKNIDADTSDFVIFGLGCGYVFDYIKQNYENVNHLIIIEPSLQMFKEYIKNEDISKWIKLFKKISFIVNQDESITAQTVNLNIVFSKKIAFVYNIAYCTIFNDYYNQVLKMVMEKIKQARVHINTGISSSYPWLINGIKNLKKDSMVIEDILDIFKNRPVILVSAGPSLNKNMHLLKEMKKKAIIIAVGMAVKILASNNITPHFRVAVDGFPREMHIIKDVNTEKVPLIFGNQLYHEFLEYYKGPTIRMILASDYIGQYLYKKSGVDYVAIGTGASVANCILNLLCVAGCSDIIFVGQDLCYVESEMYAKGANYPGDNKKTFNPARYIEAEDINGNKVYTTNIFLTFKYGFENVIKSNSNINFIDATEGGLRIEGTEIRTLSSLQEDVLNKKLDIDVENFIESRLNKDKNMEEKNRKIQDSMEVLKIEIEEILDINGEIYHVLTQFEKDRKKHVDIKELFSGLKKLETFNERLRKNKFYNSILVRALHDRFRSLIKEWEYHGDDLEKKSDSIYRISLNTVIEAQKYATLAYEVITEKL